MNPGIKIIHWVAKYLQRARFEQPCDEVNEVKDDERSLELWQNHSG
jgi:hypothetical protein